MFPFRLRLRTRLTSAEAIARLSGATRGRIGLFAYLDRLGGGIAPNEIFIGRVDGDRFRIRRNIRYRNSFVPIVRGMVVDDTTGSTIEVSLYPPVLTIGFTALWLLFFGGIAIPLLRHDGWNAVALPAATLVFGIAFPAVCFLPEAILARRRLSALLDAEPAGDACTSTVSR